MRLIGLVLALGIVVMAGFNGGKPFFFIDKPTIVFLIGFTIGSLLLNGVRIPPLLRSIFSVDLSQKEVREAIRGWGEAKIAVQVGGLASFLVGLIIVGNTLDDLKYIGVLVGMLSLNILYALIVAYVICRPMQSRLEQTLRGLEA